MAQICPNHGPSPSMQWPIVLLTEHFLGTVVQRPKFGETHSVAILRFGNDRSRGWSLTIHNSAQKILIDKLTVSSNFLESNCWHGQHPPNHRVIFPLRFLAERKQHRLQTVETKPQTTPGPNIRWHISLPLHCGLLLSYVTTAHPPMTSEATATNRHWKMLHLSPLNKPFTHDVLHENALQPTLQREMRKTSDTPCMTPSPESWKCRYANCGPQNPLTSHQIQLRCPWVLPRHTLHPCPPTSFCIPRDRVAACSSWAEGIWLKKLWGIQKTIGFPPWKVMSLGRYCGDPHFRKVP